MPRNEQPWFKFYFRSWLESERVLRMSPAAQGLYIRALATQAKYGNLPSNPEDLAVLMAVKPALMEAWPECLGHFKTENVNGEDRLFNEELRAHLEATANKIEARRAAGAIGGSKSKTKAIANGKQKESKQAEQSEAKAPPRASLSSSYSKSDSKSDFDTFYGLYPLKKKRARALEAWTRKVDSHELALQIIDHLKARVGRDPQWLKGYVEHPTTWINGQQWEDDYMATPETPVRRGPVRPGDIRNGEMAQHNGPKSAPLPPEEADIFNADNSEYWEKAAAQ